ncbi:MAG TPA: hypothetical protein VJC09_01455 [Candidatus Saccharimonadales bacterium]|nr:hypothetical protein [Candidatus Saccharimonadales bacterium]
MAKLNHIIAVSTCCFVATVMFLGFAFLPSAFAASESQSYHSDAEVTLGTIVSTDSPGSKNLTIASLDNEALVVGVVVNTKDTLVDLQPNGSNLSVATTGLVSLLVTNLFGDIKAGDNLVISPLSGVAAKDTADSNAKKYIAIANESFSSNSANAHNVSVDNVDGSNKEAVAGIIKAKMNLSNRPPNPNSENQNFIVAFLSKLVGKEINKTKLIASTVVVITTLMISGLLLQGSIRGSFVALGRNPLSKPIILSNLFRVIAISILILEVGIVVGYVILAI